jgi:hypothetical protein
MASPPRASISATAAASAEVRALTQTLAPASAKFKQIVLPIFLTPPVTSAIYPPNSFAGITM